MKISYFINYPPPFVGGLQNVCLRVAKRFQETGADVSIVGFPAEINGPENSESKKSWVYEGVQVCELRRGPLEDYLLRLVPVLKKRKVTFPLARLFFEMAYARQISGLCPGSHVFHYFGTGMEMNGYAVAKAARSTGANFFIDPALHAGQWGDSQIDAPLYQAADFIFPYSEFEVGILRKLGVHKNQIHKVMCGMEFINDGNASRFKKKHQVEGPIILFLGRKTQMKGASRLLAAWPSVIEKFPRATPVFAGASKWKDVEIEKWKSQSSNPRILDLDDISEEEKQDALAACDVLCVPSEGESFGMVYYEAWAYKKPVVALDLPVLRESIGAIEGGILTDQQPESIAKALVNLLENAELRSRLGSNGFELAQKHDWPLALNSYMAAYRHAGVDP